MKNPVILLHNQVSYRRFQFHFSGTGVLWRSYLAVRCNKESGYEVRNQFRIPINKKQKENPVLRKYETWRKSHYINLHVFNPQTAPVWATRYLSLWLLKLNVLHADEGTLGFPISPEKQCRAAGKFTEWGWVSRLVLKYVLIKKNLYLNLPGNLIQRIYPWFINVNYIPYATERCWFRNCMNSSTADDKLHAKH